MNKPGAPGRPGAADPGTAIRLNPLYYYRVSSFRRALVWLGGFTSAAFLVGRLWWIQIHHPEPLINAGNARSVRHYEFQQARGLITDRLGKILAISLPAKSVSADPQVLNQYGFAQNHAILARLSELTHTDIATLKARLGDPTRRYAPLHPHLDPDKAKEIEDLHLPGITFSDCYQRFYPAGEMCAPLIGILDNEGRGVSGIEQSFNSYLTPEVTLLQGHKDRYNHVVENLGVIRQGGIGHQLELSIDSRLQSAAFEALGAAVQEHQAESAGAVLLDVRSGEILAMASYPSFDPNDRQHYDSMLAINHAISDTFEPGSTLKPLVALAVLQSRQVSWNETLDTRPFKVDGKLVQDSHPMSQATLNDIIKYSSNTGMARLAMRAGPQRVLDLLLSLGFGHKSQLGLSGEHPGSLKEQRRFWSEIDKATLGYGYGVAVTILQLAQAYATLASGGLQVPVSILRRQRPPQPLRVINRSEDLRMLAAMESVVAGGTGKQAAIDRYRVAGKTGTAIIATHGGYQENRYVSSFAGLAPLSDPRFALVVVVRNSRQGGHFGGQVSGPVFRSVMGRALQLYNVPPDVHVAQAPDGVTGAFREGGY